MYTLRPITDADFDFFRKQFRLYQRLGFAIVGENETHYDMRCG